MTTARERRAMRRAEAKGDAYDPSRVNPSRSGRRTREQRAIDAVACPDCEAAIGQPCRMLGARPMICAGRRTAWQMVRDGEIR